MGAGQGFSSFKMRNQSQLLVIQNWTNGEDRIARAAINISSLAPINKLKFGSRQRFFLTSSGEEDLLLIVTEGRCSLCSFANVLLAALSATFAEFDGLLHTVEDILVFSTVFHFTEREFKRKHTLVDSPKGIIKE